MKIIVIVGPTGVGKTKLSIELAKKINAVIINGVSLEEILKKHEKWLNGEIGGEKADLSDTDLRHVDLRG